MHCKVKTDGVEACQAQNHLSSDLYNRQLFQPTQGSLSVCVESLSLHWLRRWMFTFSLVVCPSSAVLEKRHGCPVFNLLRITSLGQARDVRKTPRQARAGKQGATATPEASIHAQIPDSSIHSHDCDEVISPPIHLDRDRA